MPSSGDATAPVSAGYDNRPALVQFRVGNPFRGKEVLRPITYFPIYTMVLVDNDAAYTTPDVPRNAPHLRYVELAVRRNEWSRGHSAMVERRYSELRDLREILVYQFPQLIIPPLPEKSGVRHIETYFNASDAVLTQRHNMQFFLKEIAAMPEIVFFSEWVPPFFLDPRDSFETGTLLAMRAVLRTFREANRFVNQFSRRHRHFAEDAAHMIATQSTRLVRSVADFFWGGKERPAAATTTATTATTTTTTRVAAPPGPASGGWPATGERPSPSDTRFWITTMEVLERRHKALQRSAQAFEAYLATSHEKVEEQQRAVQAIEEYDRTLHGAEGFARLGDAYHLAALTLDELSGKEKDYTGGRYLNVCLRLFFEGHYIGAALDAMDHVLCLYEFLHSNAYDVRDQAYAETLAYTEAVSHALRLEYTHRYKPYYTKRMQNLIWEKLTRPSVEVSTVVDRTIRESAFARLIQEDDFVRYDEENPTN